MPTPEQISVIVPFKFSPEQPERERLLHHVVRECLVPQTYDYCRLVLVESGTDPTQENFADRWCSDYLFIQEKDGSFSLGHVQNLAIALTNPGPLFYLHLPDFLLPKHAIESAFYLMNKTEAPCVFSHYGAVNLTMPVTEGICEGKIDWEKLLSAIADITDSDGFNNSGSLIPLSGDSNRVQLTEEQVRHLDSVLPDGHKSYELINLTDNGLWGGSGDSLFCFYPWTRSTGKDEAIGNFRTGPRVKASYLCKTEAFVEVGGTTVYRDGWNAEDLWFWERLRTFFNAYSVDNAGIYYNGQKLTGHYPITHLWHSTPVNIPYYREAHIAINEFRQFASLPRENKLSLIQHLNLAQLREEGTI